MGVIDTLADIGTALGKGIYSVGEDIVLGAERTAEGLGVRGTDRMYEIADENEKVVAIMSATVRYAISDGKNPITAIVTVIMYHYYVGFPDEVMAKLAKAAGLTVAKTAGRALIGKALAQKIARGIAMKIAASAAYKQLAKKLGLSSAARSTGIGMPISMILLQGLAQRASDASRRLRKKFPELYNELQDAGGLDMIFFLVEKPMSHHLEAIGRIRANKKAFQDGVRRIHGFPSR